MVIVGYNETWTIAVTDHVSTSTTATDDGWIVKRSHSGRLDLSDLPAPCPPPEHCKPDAQWNAEKKRRELAGIKAAQQKHERMKLSACKTARKVLKYYREPRFNAVNAKTEVER